MEAFSLRRPGGAIQSIRQLRMFHLFRGEGLKARALRGSAWTMFGTSMDKVLRLGSSLILTRLLVPEVYGLMAIVWLVLSGLQMFSDIGVGPAVVRDPRGDDPAFINTAWTLQVIRGFALALVAGLLAWPFAVIYGQPMLKLLIPVAAITAIISGFSSTKVAQTTRHMELGRLTIQQLITRSTGIVSTIAIALIWPSVWAIVFGTLIGSCVSTVLTHTFLEGTPNRFYFEKRAARELFHFGKWIFLSSLIFFLSKQMDRALIGGLISMRELGIYSIAFMLAEVPIQINMILTRKVAYPAMSQIQMDQPERIQEVYYRIRQRLDLIFLPALGLMMGGGGLLVVILLYDPRYLPAGWIFQALCLRAAMRCMLEPNESTLVALGYPKYALYQHITRLIWMVTMLPLGWYWGGFFGLVIVVATSEFGSLAVLWWGLNRHGVLRLYKESLSWGLILISLLVGTFIPVLLQGYFIS